MVPKVPEVPKVTERLSVLSLRRIPKASHRNDRRWFIGLNVAR